MTQSALSRANDRKLLNRLIEQRTKAWHGHDMAMTKPARRRLSSLCLTHTSFPPSLSWSACSRAPRPWGVPHQETFWQALNLEDAARPIGRLSSRFETIRPSHGGVRVRLGVVGEDVSGLGVRKGRDAAHSKTLAKGNKSCHMP